MKNKTAYQKRIIKLVVNGILATIALLFAIISTKFIVDKDKEILIPVTLGISTFTLALIYFLRLFFEERTKIKVIYAVTISSLYIVLTILGYLIKVNYIFFNIYAIFLSLIIIVSSIIKMIENHKKRSLITNILKIVFSILFALIFTDFSLEQEEIRLIFIIVNLVLAGICFYLAMVMVFSGIRRTTLTQILRKTYAIEILYGLIILIIATALMLSILEPSITNIGDALWYCFAIVTTIGFGDFAATSVIGRILSVVLGIYGIIVVALITSIIVNFYNETKKENDDKIIKEEIDKLEHNDNKE